MSRSGQGRHRAGYFATRFAEELSGPRRLTLGLAVAVLSGRLNKQAEALVSKLGPEYSTMMDGLEQVDRNSSEAKEFMSILSGLDKLCTGPALAQPVQPAPAAPAQSDPNDARRQAWNGKWPGEDDCQRLDFFVNGDPDFPDLNCLFTDCNSAKRWVRAFNPARPNREEVHAWYCRWTTT